MEADSAPDFEITDSLGNPIDISAVKWTSASSLYNYLKSKILHLAVAPDFIAREDQNLVQAAPTPLTFKLSLQHEFQLGNTQPEIDVTPGTEIALFVNTTAAADLLEGDSFHLPAIVPGQTAYVGMSFKGSLDLGVSGSSGDLTFGIDREKSITIEFFKAFSTARNPPPLWDATAAMISGFVIPARVEDLERLDPNDVCCVSGEGSLKVSGSVNITLPVNPLASVNLPLGVGTLAVQDGVLAGLSVSLTLSGSYEIRVEKLTSGTIRLSYVRAAGAAAQTDLTASVGVSVNLGTTDLLAKLLGVIGSGKVDPKILDGLSSDDIGDFTDAVKAGIDHSLRASIDYALSDSVDKQTAFQYEIQPHLLDSAAKEAVNRALKGDLSLLTALEERAQPDGMITAGVKLLNSVFSTAKTRGASLKVNLLGIVNLVTVSNLIDNCEFLFEPASGDLTIKETAGSDRITAITDPYKRQAALCKAMFDSVLATTTYVVSKSVTMPSLACETAHFAMNQNTNAQTIADYTRWFLALNLLGDTERSAMLSRAGSGGYSSCVVSAPLDDAACEALFFDGDGKLRARADYLEIGRRALRALLDPGASDIDAFRCQILDGESKWQQAVHIGPSPELRVLIPLESNDPKLPVVMNDISGDVYDIAWWANAMCDAGAALSDMRAFLAGRNPASLRDDPAFARQRDSLQKAMLKIVGSSKVRFNEPWGLVCLFRASGSRAASGKLTSRTLTVERKSPAAAIVTAGKSAQ